MSSPYDNLPGRAFWRQAVADRAPLDPGEIYDPPFGITQRTRITTAGSCFAQHLGRHLRQAGFDVLDEEPLHSNLPDDIANRFGYRLYSARYGNVYTVRQMLQLVQEATGARTPGDIVWEQDGRFFDALRPGIEPQGHASPDLVHAHRADHLAAVKRLLPRTDLFVFTLGLTEAWVHRETGTVFPSAPGVIAGDAASIPVEFVNFSYAEILEDLLELRALVRQHRHKARFLLTVSPVPLTATASGQHVEVATARSKAILRAVCAEMDDRFLSVGYFPSYEIITSPAARGAYFEGNLRNVSAAGVRRVMEVFMAAHQQARPPDDAPPPRGLVQLPGTRSMAEIEEAFCEEALLAAFGK